MVVSHPLRENGAAAAHDAGDALGNQRQILDQHAGVNRHVVHALRGLLFDHFQHDFSVQIFHALHASDGFVNRHGADGNGRMAQDGFANFVNVAAGGKIHYGVGAVMHGGVQLFQFLVDFRRDRRIADVGVDLAQRRHADRHWLEFRMIDVGGNDHAAAGHFVAHQFGRQLFAVGDVTHLFRDHALTGIVHLRKVAGGVLLLASGEPLCARLRNAVTIVAVTVGSSWGKS